LLNLPPLEICYLLPDKQGPQSPAQRTSIHDAAKRIFPPLVEAAVFGPLRPFAITSRCCGAACHSGRSRIVLQFVGSNVDQRIKTSSEHDA
jgi:hypothetical protein